MKRASGKHHNKLFWNIVLFLFILGLSFLIMQLIRQMLMEEAWKLGKETVNSYSGEEEQNLETYRNLIDVGAAYMEELVSQEKDEEVIRKWLADYYKILTDAVGTDTLDLFAVLEDEVIPIGGKEGEKICISDAGWYEMALEADGEAVYTDTYFSEVYQRPVITLAEKCGDTGNVIAFVLFPENLRVRANTKLLPEGSSYFMCDSEGVILYAETDLELKEDEQGRAYFQDLYQNTGSKNRADKNGYVYFYDHTGRKMAVFYKEVPNGWFSILTMPEAYLASHWERIIGFYLLLCIGFYLIFLIITIKEHQSHKNEKRENETVHILGNSYYALYRINIETATYDIIKASDYVREHLPLQGDYYELLEVLRDIIAEDAYEEFAKSFSIENIREQIEHDVKDFGGDFQRIFNEERKWVNVRMLFDPVLSKNEVVLCFRQVEEEKQRQLERMELLEEAVELAHASEKSQKQFFSNMSHDMRTPLNVIIGMSELAGKNVEDTEKVTDYLKKINMSSRQLLGLINDILEMSRLEQGIKLNSEAFDLQEVLEESLNVFRMQAKEAHKKFSFRSDIVNEKVYGDPLRLNQILNNLLSNALKFTKTGDSISVNVCQISHGEYAKFRIEVADTGIGMSEDFFKNLFVPYEREKRFGSQNVEGTGLGMPIVKSIVALMGGEITVKSTLNGGTVFTVILPFEISEMETKQGKESEKGEIPEKEDTPEAEVQKEEAPEQEKGHAAPLQDRQILLAEDYELNMELATDILEMNGAKVVQARNGKEALELFGSSEEYSIDAILMDMQMPVMDGCEAAEAVRALSRADAASVPIIALTANAFSEDIARTLKAGMNAHITKPIDVKLLCDTLNQWMQKRKKETGGSCHDGAGML